MLKRHIYLNGKKIGWDEQTIQKGEIYLHGQKICEKMLNLSVITKEVKPQWGLNFCFQPRRRNTHTRFTLLPGAMKTLDKPYDLRALKTVNWVMAISDHKRQEASRVSPTAAPILVQSFRAMLREGDPEPDRLPELRKQSWSPGIKGMRAENKQGESLTRNLQILAGVSTPCPQQASSENWSRQVRQVPQAKERNF